MSQADTTPSPESRERRSTLAPILIFVAIWLGGSWLVVATSVAAFTPGGWLTLLALPLVFVLPIRALARGFGGIAYPGRHTRVWLFRPFWYAMLFVPLLAIATILGAVAGLALGDPGQAARVALAASSAIFLILGLAGYVGSRRLVVRHIRARLPRLPPAFEHLKIAQISDLHVGPHTPSGFLARVVDGVMQSDPDLIVMTGDQVDDFPRDTQIYCSALKGLEAPLGVFAIAGNHDVYAGWSAVRQGLESGGISVLENDAVAFEREGQRLWLAGTGDPAAGSALASESSGAPDVARTVEGISSSDVVIALAHNPALWPALTQFDVDLTLSGHTHYGQFAIPWLGWCLASPFLQLAMGSHRRGQSLLYINPGTNYWGVPLRLGTPPEITILTLERGEEAQLYSSERSP